MSQLKTEKVIKDTDRAANDSEVPQVKNDNQLQSKHSGVVKIDEEEQKEYNVEQHAIREDKAAPQETLRLVVEDDIDACFEKELDEIMRETGSFVNKNSGAAQSIKAGTVINFEEY